MRQSAVQSLRQLQHLVAPVGYFGSARTIYTPSLFEVRQRWLTTTFDSHKVDALPIVNLWKPLTARNPRRRGAVIPGICAQDTVAANRSIDAAMFAMHGVWTHPQAIRWRTTERTRL